MLCLCSLSSENPFEVHTDASDYQLGTVISQHGKPIAFYSCKLTSTQQRYTMGEREILSIVGTLKEFWNILLVQKIIFWTDHKNLTLPKTAHASNCIQQWRWLIEELSPEIQAIKGPRNVVADVLSRLKVNFLIAYSNEDKGKLSKRFGKAKDDLDASQHVYPLSAWLIEEYQKDKVLFQHLKDDHHSKFCFEVLEGTDPIPMEGKIYIPKQLRKWIMEWYHELLCHPGMEQTEQSIHQYLVWPGLTKVVEQFDQSCHDCQVSKSNQKKYAHIPVLDKEEKPWHTLCIGSDWALHYHHAC